MSQAPIDPEELAAFIDGRLDATHRGRVLERLAESPEAYELYVESLRTLDGPEGMSLQASPDDDGRATGRRESSHRRWGRPLAAAAVLAALAVFGTTAVEIIRRPAQGASVLTLVDMLDPTKRPAPGEFERLFEQDWARLRGGGREIDAAAAEVTRRRAFRVGVREVDLAVAIAAGDLDAVASAGVLLAAETNGDPAGAVSALLYRQLADSARAAVGTDKLRGLLREAELASPPPMATRRLGRLAEAARMAAHARDTAFFASMPVRERLADLVGPDMPEAARAAAERVMVTLAGPPPPDLATLGAALDSLVASGG